LSNPAIDREEVQFKCRIENEFFTLPERHLNDEMSETFTLGRRGKCNFEQLFSDFIPFAYVAE